MAYVPKQLPDDEENQFGRTDLTTPTPPPQAGSSAGSTGQGGAAPGVGTSTQFGSNAAKLTDYLSANKEQVGEFGQQIAGKLGEQYGEAKNAVDEGFQGYNQAVNSGFNQVDPNKVNEAIQNPTEYAKDPNNVSQFQGWYNNQYGGPENVESWQPYQNINKSVNSAVQNAGLVNNFGGLSSYLNNFMGAGKNTQGMNTLDTALLTRSPEASQTIKQAAQPFEGLNQYLSGKISEGNNSVQNAKGQVEQSRNDLRNKFTGEGGVIPNFQADLSNRLTQGKQNYQTQLTNAQRNYANGALTPEDIQFLGLKQGDLSDDAFMNQSEIAKILSNEYGSPVDMTQFIQGQNPDVLFGNANSVATQGDLERQQALRQLTGQDINAVDPNSPFGVENGVNVNRETGLWQQLNGKDMEALKKATAGDMDSWGNPSNVYEFIANTPNLAYQLAQSKPELAKVLKRLGLNINPPENFTSNPPPTNGGGTFSAS